jgi:membrane protein implicated in regulation of membrane protease activity
MSSIAIASTLLSVLFLLQTVNYVAFESSGAFLIPTLTTGITTLALAVFSAFSVKLYSFVHRPVNP